MHVPAPLLFVAVSPHNLEELKLFGAETRVPDLRRIPSMNPILDDLASLCEMLLKNTSGLV
jgi:hypothetical protein